MFSPDPSTVMYAVPGEWIPALEPLRVGLFYKHPRLSAAGLQLVSDLVADLESVGSGVGPVTT